MLLRILARSSWRFYSQHPAQLCLSILGIVLGVGIVTAVLITNASSQRAFALSSEALYGKATHQIIGANGLDQRTYVNLKRQFPDMAMAPVVMGYVAIENTVYSLLGLDPFAETAFARTGIQTGLGSAISGSVSGATSKPTNTNKDDALAQIFLNPQSLLVSQISVDNNQLPLGHQIAVEAGGKRYAATLAGGFTSSNPAASTGMLIGDIAFVQGVLQRGEKIDRIDLIINDEQLAAITQALSNNARIAPAAARTQTLQAMTRGFHINLTAMSLLALVVGVFLIHNTMTFAVVQRRELFAIKRIIGVQSRSVLAIILGEATLISLVGSLLGIVLGYALAHTLVQLTTRTINDLYFVLHIQHIWFSPWLVVGGIAMGVGSSLVAATLSAFDAASTSPIQARQRSILEQRSLKAIPYMALGGCVFIALGIALALLPVPSLWVGFSALMSIILGYGLIIPYTVYSLTHFIKPLVDKISVPLALATGGIYRNISRTGLAIAALSIAVSATFGVDVMIGSFRASVDQWLRTTLQSDIYISAPSTVSTQRSMLLDDRTLQIVQGTSGVESVSRGVVIDTASSLGDLDMLVLTPHADHTGGFELLESDPDEAWLLWSNPRQNTIMISEPLANKRNLAVGDVIELFTELSGEKTFAIVGVFSDFGSSHGKLLMARSTFDQYWQADGVGSLGIIVHEKFSANELVQQLRQRLAVTGQPLTIQSNADIHRMSLVVFDRTFEVTKVLRWLTVGVAFVGIFSALLALHLERAREFAILRACGATRRKTMQIVLYQTLMMGLMAGLLALPLGWLMSEVLINVINVRSFGWSMKSILPLATIPEALLLASFSAVLAGIYPAYRLSRSGIASQLSDE